jgi:hypothetical protein
MQNDDLQKKIMEAGIVPEGAVKQMEQWQAVPVGASENVGEADLKKVRNLRSDLELRGLPSIREAVMDIKKIMEKGRTVLLKVDNLAFTVEDVGMDRLDRYIFEIPTDSRSSYDLLSKALRPMTALIDNGRAEPENNRHITAVSLLYTDEVPTHWFCETEAKGKKTIIKGR